MPLTRSKSFRQPKPAAGRASSTAAAREAVRPATCRRSSAEAELRSTPTWHTHACTTRDSSATSRGRGTSGSCSLLASEAAPRVPASVPGSAAAAGSVTESTDAPASFTTEMRTCATAGPPPASASATTSCVSRDAVPLPIATTLTPCRAIHSRSVPIASSRRDWGGCGWMSPPDSSRPDALDPPPTQHNPVAGAEGAAAASSAQTHPQRRSRPPDSACGAAPARAPARAAGRRRRRPRPPAAPPAPRRSAERAAQDHASTACPAQRGI
eukprot:scaffold7712_cov119-Isochrysis_galbana.AAC.3